jgi:hypothetical protein
MRRYTLLEYGGVAVEATGNRARMPDMIPGKRIERGET